MGAGAYDGVPAAVAARAAGPRTDIFKVECVKKNANGGYSPRMLCVVKYGLVLCLRDGDTVKRYVPLDRIQEVVVGTDQAGVHQLACRLEAPEVDLLVKFPATTQRAQLTLDGVEDVLLALRRATQRYFKQELVVRRQEGVNVKAAVTIASNPAANGVRARIARGDLGKQRVLRALRGDAPVLAVPAVAVAGIPVATAAVVDGYGPESPVDGVPAGADVAVWGML